MINISKARWKAVAKYSMKTGELLETYPSITLAARENNIHRQSLNKCIVGKSNSSGGFYWIYIKNYKHNDQKICCKCKKILNNENRAYTKYNLCKECRKRYKFQRLYYVNEFLGKIYRRQRYEAKKTKIEMLYSLDEFLGWVSKQKDFFNMYRLWVESNQNKNLTPHIARIDTSIPYRLDNLEIISKEQWRRKMWIPIEQWTKDRTKLLCTYSSIAEASRETGVESSKIISVAKSRRSKSGNKSFINRTGGGYYWKYSDKFKEEL